MSVADRHSAIEEVFAHGIRGDLHLAGDPCQ